MNVPDPDRPPRRGVDRRSAARLAAVQAVYQADGGGDDPETLILDFLTHRRGALLDPEGGDGPVAMDTALFEDLVRGTLRRRESIDVLLGECLSDKWPLHRVERVLRAILRCAGYELLSRDDIPPRATISEYLDIAHAFFEGEEAKFANGVLNALARRSREDELLSPPNGSSGANGG